MQLEYNPVPNLTRLLQNYPNPFNPKTRIPFQLNQDAEVSVSIYNVSESVHFLLGFDLRASTSVRIRLYIGMAGQITVRQCLSGIYFYQLNAGDDHSTSRMGILK